MNIIHIMEQDFDILAYTLSLSPRQRRALFAEPDKYDLSRLAVRDGVLYATRKDCGIFGTIRKMIFGRRVDLIGR